MAKGMAGTVQRIQKKSAGLDGAKGLENDVHLIDVHFADVDGNDSRHWSQLAIVRLARTMHDKGPITKARKAWVMAAKERVGKNTASVPRPSKTPVRRSAGLGKVAANLTGPVARLILWHGAQAEHGPGQGWPAPLQDSAQVPEHR